jgi:hypothetical protein
MRASFIPVRRVHALLAAVLGLAVLLLGQPDHVGVGRRRVGKPRRPRPAAKRFAGLRGVLRTDGVCSQTADFPEDVAILESRELR